MTAVIVLLSLGLFTWPVLSIGGVPWGIVTDSEGNVIVMGETNGSLTTIKYDPNGKLIWKNEFDEGRYAGKITVDSDDNVYVVGENQNGVVLMVKYSKDGKEEWWNACLGGVVGGWRTGIAVDKDKNIIVATTGSDQPVLAKIGTDGYEIWYKTLSVKGIGTGVVVDSKNNIIMSGSLGPWNGFWAMKVNPAGDSMWLRTYPASGAMTWDMAISSRDEIAVSGGMGDGYLLLIKYASNGNTKWSLEPNEATGLGASFDNNGNLLVFALGGRVIKYSPQGVLLWSKNYFEDSSWPWGDVTADRQNNYYITCYDNGGFYTVKTDTAGNLAVPETNVRSVVREDGLKIYPNPFVRFARLLSKAAGEIKIYDRAGNLVERTENKEFGFNLPAGVYFVRVEGYPLIKVIKLK